MQCPYCGNEMQSGYIPTGTTPAQWIPDGGKESWLKMQYAKDCIRLVSKDNFWGMRAKADRCDACGIILLKDERDMLPADT